MGIENGNGHYVRLQQDCDSSQCNSVQPELQLKDQKKCYRIWWWIKAAVISLFLIGAGAVILFFGGPIVINKVTFLQTSFVCVSVYILKTKLALLLLN